MRGGSLTAENRSKQSKIKKKRRTADPWSFKSGGGATSVKRDHKSETQKENSGKAVEKRGGNIGKTPPFQRPPTPKKDRNKQAKISGKEEGWVGRKDFTG